jgi:hypothetical protein
MRRVNLSARTRQPADASETPRHGEDNSERSGELSAESEGALQLALWELESYLEHGTFTLLARPRLDAAALAQRCGIPS